jgi:DGQHR domain-containing protein
MNKIEIKNILKVNQPIGTYLVGVMKASDLLKVTDKNPRKYNQVLDNYAGIQRELNDKKIKHLKEFIKTKDATFPNTIIVALNPDKYQYHEKDKTLFIDEDKRSLSIIDGQHRLASFKDEVNIGKDFELIVSFFLGPDVEEQAYLFSIINMTQKKLNPSLMRDLTELFTITTPEKLAHNLASSFNKEKNGPWTDMIKMLGKNDRSKGIISQYTFTKSIIELIYNDEKYSYKVRDFLKINKNERLKLKDLNEIKLDPKRYIFWDFYINEEDNKIFNILNDYFLSLKEIYTDQWCNDQYILSKTTGYNAFMKLLADLFNISISKREKLNKDFFKVYLTKIESSLKELKSTNYNPGAQGEGKLYSDLKKIIYKK